MFKDPIKVNTPHLDSINRRLDEFYDENDFLIEPVNMHGLILIVRELLGELRDTQECLERLARE